MSWWTTNETHDPALESWVTSANGHGCFPVQNLPFGIFSTATGRPRIGVAIGDMILDLAACADAALLPAAMSDFAADESLNRLLSASWDARQHLRQCLSHLLTSDDKRTIVERALHPAAACTLHLPMTIGDYTDFYVGIYHATNVGRLFRPDAPLLPNYKHVPIGYHGRASSVRPSGEPVVRPSGQRKDGAMEAPVFGPSTRLDYELELGVWIGSGNALGKPIPIGQAAQHVAGLCLLNDWSARDLQAWEYQPLGPFLSKSFHSTISPWVVTTEALAPFRVAQPPRASGDPAPLPYLLDGDDQRHGAFSITLEAFISSAEMRARDEPPVRLSKGPATSMYWTVHQMVAHHTSNGCNLNPGDLLGTGTVSAPTRDGWGSLLELSEGGQRPVLLPGGESRTFLNDGDDVVLRATASAPGFVPIGFGECRAVVLPAV